MGESQVFHVRNMVRPFLPGRQTSIIPSSCFLTIDYFMIMIILFSQGIIDIQHNDSILVYIVKWSLSPYTSITRVTKTFFLWWKLLRFTHSNLQICNLLLVIVTMLYIIPPWLNFIPGNKVYIYLPSSPIFPPSTPHHILWQPTICHL